MISSTISLAVALALFLLAGYNASALPDLYEASILELQEGLRAGDFTSVDLVRTYFARIDEVNLKGPQLRAVLEINPSALEQAKALDDERSTKGPRSDLHGIPILLKDNIGTVSSEGLNTTAGSFSLLGSIVPEDAFVVKKLREAGAIILGKASMSEWAQFRGDVAAGWSGRGGQSSNAYFLGGDPCGSSSGSAIATSIGLITVSLGTETSGSITCPSSNNNVVGIKPTVGLTSRSGVIPISEHQDTVGPLARSVQDAAIVLSIIAGVDAQDNFTLSPPQPVPDYTKSLDVDALRGARLGIPRRAFLNNSLTGNDPFVNVAFETAVQVMRDMGATIIDPADLPSTENSENLDIVLEAEGLVEAIDFKIQLNKYLSTLPQIPSGVHNLGDVITFNNNNPKLEEPANFTDQSTLLESQETNGFNQTYFSALATGRNLSATNGIDAALKTHQLDALILPAPGFAFIPSAVVGYPIVTVPLDFYPANVTTKPVGPLTVYPAPGLPLGLCFIGTAFSEIDLIRLAFAFEQKTKTRLKRKAVPAAVPSAQLDVVDRE